MIRVSIETLEYRERVKPIVDLRDRFYHDGILVGFDLKKPDLRILHQNIAIEELEKSPNQRLRCPTIVDERVDGAQVIANARVRSALAHPDVKLWLKLNTYRDFQLNNGRLVAGRHHYQLLNEVPAFRLSNQPGATEMPVTAEMASKIRLLPMVGIDRLAFYREQEINWQQKRPIDVMFAGLVDYEVRGSDFWDHKYAEAQAATTTGPDALIDFHRRAAVQQLTLVRHLRTLIGMNRALQQDLYRPAMLRSSIAVSPWGFGEFAYRDYEAILSGCVLVKPLSDHIETFAPDIYQSNKYYVPCRPDFSDLPEVIERIMSDRNAALALARRAREDMLAANSADRVYAYYFDLFQQALGEDLVSSAQTPPRGPILALGAGPQSATRAEIASYPVSLPQLGSERMVTLKEDCSPRNSHDLRLSTDGVAPPGLYRLRVIARPRDRDQVALQLHHNWQDSIAISINLATLTTSGLTEKGNLFARVYGPEVSRLPDGWVIVSLAVTLSTFLEAGLSLVMYAADAKGEIFYDGRGCIAFDVAVLDFSRVDMRYDA